MTGLARGFALVVPLAVVAASALLEAAHAGEPHRPPTRGTFFIPFGDNQQEDSSPQPDARSAGTFEAAGPAEAALAAIPDAPELAHALRALVALDAEKVRRAPDMASAVGAHLPRYRLRQTASLRAEAASDTEVVAAVEAGLSVILVAVEGGWQQLYVPSRHQIGWLRRTPASP